MGFLAVGIDPTEGPDVLQRYQAQQGYPWPAAPGNRSMIETYKVTQTSIKYGVDQRGVITHQRGYGVGSPADWDDWLRSLAGG